MTLAVRTLRLDGRASAATHIDRGAREEACDPIGQARDGTRMSAAITSLQNSGRSDG
jgi:hypothetical protein